jgi:hypothetical protein
MHVEKSMSTRFTATLRFVLAVIITSALLLATPFSIAGPPSDDRTSLTRTMDRPSVETLQRWVSSGHASWCKDARMVASNELRRIVPDAASGEGELFPLDLDAELTTDTKAVFIWSSWDGQLSYRVTVQRFTWLLPLAGRLSEIVWVPTSTEAVPNS